MAPGTLADTRPPMEAHAAEAHDASTKWTGIIDSQSPGGNELGVDPTQPRFKFWLQSPASSNLAAPPITLSQLKAGPGSTLFFCTW